MQQGPTAKPQRKQPVESQGNLMQLPCGSHVLRAVLWHQYIHCRIRRREALPHGSGPPLLLPPLLPLLRLPLACCCRLARCLGDGAPNLRHPRRWPDVQHRCRQWQAAAAAAGRRQAAASLPQSASPPSASAYAPRHSPLLSHVSGIAATQSCKRDAGLSASRVSLPALQRD